MQAVTILRRLGWGGIGMSGVMDLFWSRGDAKK